MTSTRPSAYPKWLAGPAIFIAVFVLAGSSSGEHADSAPPAEPAGEVTLHGRVLLPDGKPASAVNVYWLQLKKAEPPAKSEVWWLKRAVTDGEGRFQWTLEKTDARFGPANRPPIIAYQPGLGIAGLAINRDDASAELTLRLVEEQPIRGRLIDTEGRPVVGASVKAPGIQSPRDGGLDRFLDVWKRQRHDANDLLDRPLSLGYPSLPGGLAATTDERGRFELTGAGAERLITLSVTAPGYMSEEIKVVTRKDFDAERFNAAVMADAPAFMRALGRIPRLMGPAFDRVLEAELVIRGKVFTGADHKPVTGGSVSSPSGGPRFVSAPLDSTGHFELRGVRRSSSVPLIVDPSGDLLSRFLKFDIAPGQTTLDVEVEVKEGIAVEGRVFDQATGQGVKSRVSYVPLPQNHFLKQPDYDGAKSLGGNTSTDDEGRFRRLVIPGSGVLLVQVHEGGPTINGKQVNRYRQANFTDEESKLVPITVDGDDRMFTTSDNSLVFLGGQNAVKVIDLKPDVKAATYDLAVDPGKTAQIKLEDEQGQPVTNAFTSGIADCWPHTFRIAESACTIYGLGADRPRRVCILHPELRLAASLTLTGDEVGPVTVRLAEPASIKGRALDAEGEPLADAQVQINYAHRSASELRRFVELEKGQVRTDREGRFRVDVVPGERFALDFRHDNHFYRAPLTDDQRTLKAAQRLELGDMKPKFIQ